ncbi:OmpH family outer membrane protein [Aquifex pyrophilus]
MKKFFLSLALAGGFIFALDFACVDTNKIIRESKFIAKTQQEFKRDIEKYQREIESKQKKLEELKKKAESGVISEKAKKKTMEEIERLEEELRKLQVEAQTKLTKKKSQLEQMIFDKVIAVVENKAKNKGLKAVFDCNMLLYKDQSIDITDEILKELDK